MLRRETILLRQARPKIPRTKAQSTKSLVLLRQNSPKPTPSTNRLLAKIDAVNTKVNSLTKALSDASQAPNLRKHLSSSEKKINREDLFASIVMNPGLTIVDHCVRNGIPRHAASKYLASLNALRLVKEC